MKIIIIITSILLLITVNTRKMEAFVASWFLAILLGVEFTIYDRYSLTKEQKILKNINFSHYIKKDKVKTKYEIGKKLTLIIFEYIDENPKLYKNRKIKKIRKNIYNEWLSFAELTEIKKIISKFDESAPILDIIDENIFDYEGPSMILLYTGYRAKEPFAFGGRGSNGF